MTEPEELDEDLFADLVCSSLPLVTADVRYDQDEAPARVEPSIKPEVAPDPVEPPDRNGAVPDQPMLDVKEDAEPETSRPQQHDYSNDMNGDSGSGWQDGHATGGNGHDYESVIEPESHGTGIKEDG
ncbi:hypothetical protein MMC13_006530 [Lambiella insularis]|nr:hypothetical protein [Lambiella insularis]